MVEWMMFAKKLLSTERTRRREKKEANTVLAIALSADGDPSSYLSHFHFPRRRQRTSEHDMDSNSRRAPCAQKHFPPPQNSSRHRLYVRLDFVHSSLQSQISRLLTLAENPPCRNQDDSAISRAARWNCAIRFMRVDSHPRYTGFRAW